MKNLITKHWITSLGILFLFSAFIYFLKMAFELGWFPPEVRVLSGLVLGVSLLFTGFSFYRKDKKNTCEIFSGLGISLMYATFAYITFSDSIDWPNNITFISVLSMTCIVAVISSRFELRGLIFISIMGGLISPILLKAQESHDTILFLYVLILNIASLYLSVLKKWSELRIMSFIVTVIIYSTYYIYFEPITWGKPFFYASTLFVVYMGGMIMASWKEKDSFTGLNVYLGLINAILFVFWTIFILSSFSISFILPLIFAGLTFIASALIVYFLSGKNAFPGIIYAVLGFILFAIAASNIKPMMVNGMEHVVTTFMWFVIILSIYMFGSYFKNKDLKFISILGWGILIVYWFFVAWKVEWIKIFGITYIPFINAGAFIWILLAGFGFHLTEKFEKDSPNFSVAVAIVSNFIVAGLFNVQISNLWEAYTINFIELELALSIAYFMYALLIFLWGARTKSVPFRIIGAVVLLVISAKVFFFDLSGEASLNKIISLLIIGGITLTIAQINKKWSNTVPIKEKEGNINIS